MERPGVACVYVVVALMICTATVESSPDGPVLTSITEPVAHAEGPHWDPTDKVLYYVDITGQALHRYDPATKSDKHLKMDKPVALAVPVKGERNRFVLGLGRDYVLLTWDWDSGTHHVSILASVDPGDPGNRFNDGKADAKGRVWAGTMGHEAPMGHVTPDRGSLYRLSDDPEAACTAMPELRPVNISNGLTWSHDNRVLYYIDTPSRRVDAFDFDLDKGDISNRRTVFEFGELPGSPDGMTIDADGNLWIACWGGSQVIKVDPASGKLLQTIQFPVTFVSSVAWGGAALDTLYVTTMRLGLTPAQEAAQPLAGAVFRVTGLNTTGTLQHPAVVSCMHH